MAKSSLVKYTTEFLIVLINFFSLQSGNEARSRVDSVSSNLSDHKGENHDDGEFIDYKALWEAAK